MRLLRRPQVPFRTYHQALSLVKPVASQRTPRAEVLMQRLRRSRQRTDPCKPFSQGFPARPTREARLAITSSRRLPVHQLRQGLLWDLSACLSGAVPQGPESSHLPQTLRHWRCDSAKTAGLPGRSALLGASRRHPRPNVSQRSTLAGCTLAFQRLWSREQRAWAKRQIKGQHHIAPPSRD